MVREYFPAEDRIPSWNLWLMSHNIPRKPAERIGAVRKLIEIAEKYIPELYVSARAFWINRKAEIDWSGRPIVNPQTASFFIVAGLALDPREFLLAANTPTRNAEKTKGP